VELYQWIKALHLISVIAWMAGLLYLPRLYVYHCGVSEGSEAAETFKVMERRLLRGIMNPAMIATWVFGLWLLFGFGTGIFQQGWMHAKLVLVVAMTVLHHIYAVWRKDFEAGRNRRTARFYRFTNEVPAVLMVLIVILVIVQPF
jgi:protoporphyrinogen IX oxidase